MVWLLIPEWVDADDLSSLKRGGIFLWGLITAFFGLS